MIVEISFIVAAIVVGSVVGFVIGKSYTDNKTTVRLRKRGYTIKSVTNFGYHAGYKFIYNGFNDKLQTVLSEGPTLPEWDDAVANADAHYYAKTIKDSSFDINKVC